MRRKPGHLLDLEAEILAVAIEALGAGSSDLHGFALARELADRTGARQLTAHGTLYKALSRLEQAELLASEWEDPAVAEAEGRPRRRLYRITGPGQVAYAAHASTGTAGVQFGAGTVTA
jgi:DNA-binding PadR family transcriptional regulator